MKCPSCRRPVDHEANSCYSCGYSALQAMKNFGFDPVKMRQIHDVVGCLRASELNNINQTLQNLEDRFPQLLFAVYFGELTETISIGELGFWLLNQATVEGASVVRSNENGIFLVIDVHQKQAGISLGYCTEMLLTEADCLRALRAARSFFRNGEFGAGVVVLWRKLEKSLATQAQKMKNLGRAEIKAQVLKSHHGANAVIIPGPGIPAQFDPNRGRQIGQPIERLNFKNEFENNLP
jgi:uncharacterized membrane protein YgcG